MFVDLTNQRFGRLIVVKKLYKDRWRKWYWECICDCGNTTVVTTTLLKKGHTQSCGCIHREQLIERNYKHGLSDSFIDRVWYSMLSRCYNLNNKAYKNYGGRGIKICEEWLDNKLSFFKWAEESHYSEGLSIDRIDNDGDYTPENCRWATNEQQANNTRNNHFIMYKGETKTVAQWENHFKLNRGVISTRLNRYNWSEEKALTTPVTTILKRSVKRKQDESM